MQYHQFINSLSDPLPPASLTIYLKALWLDANKDWAGAHGLINDQHDPLSAWIHAYLHRKEGDFANADYWYRMAKKKPSRLTVDQEWRLLVAAFTEA